MSSSAAVAYKGDPQLIIVSDLFGGQKTLKHVLNEPLDAHDLITKGIPRPAFVHFLKSLRFISSSIALEKAIGISERTLQRHKGDLEKHLSHEQSSRTWKFAHILAKATTVFGSQEEAEKWMVEPAIGLNGNTPIDLIATTAGADLVETFLDQIDHGVYV